MLVDFKELGDNIDEIIEGMKHLSSKVYELECKQEYLTRYLNKDADFPFVLTAEDRIEMFSLKDGDIYLDGNIIYLKLSALEEPGIGKKYMYVKPIFYVCTEEEKKEYNATLLKIERLRQDSLTEKKIYAINGIDDDGNDRCVAILKEDYELHNSLCNSTYVRVDMDKHERGVTLLEYL